MTPTRLPNYRPLPLRWPLLVSCFLFLCILIGLLEGALRVLPLLQDRTSVPHQVHYSRYTASKTGINLEPRADSRSDNRSPKRKAPRQWVYTNETSSSANRTTPTGLNTTITPGADSDVYTNSTGALTNGTTSKGLSTASWRHPKEAILDPDDYANLDGWYKWYVSWNPGDFIYNEHNLMRDDSNASDLNCRCRTMNEVMSGWPRNTPLECVVYVPPDATSRDDWVWVDPGCFAHYQSDLNNNGGFRGDCPWIDGPAPECELMEDDFPGGLVTSPTSPIGMEDTMHTVTQVIRTVDVATWIPGSPGHMSTYQTATTLTYTDYAHWQAPTIITETDIFGRPTATVTKFGSGVLQTMTVETLRDARGVPTATITTNVPLSTRLVTLYRTEGGSRIPTKTVTAVHHKSSYITLLDANGDPTATLTTELPEMTTDVVTAYGLSGAIATATATLIEYSSFSSLDPVNPASERVVGGSTTYFIGFFLPVILATLISLWIETIAQSVRQLLPFRNMLRRGGGTADVSLCLHSSGLRSWTQSCSILWRYWDPLPLFTDILVVCAALANAFSSSAIGLKLVGSCHENNARGCAMVLGTFADSVRLVEGLVIALAALVAIITILIGVKRSGVAHPPWSLAAMTSLLASSRELRDFLRSVEPREGQDIVEEQEYLDAARGKSFTLQLLPKSETEGEIGISIIPTAGRKSFGPPKESLARTISRKASQSSQSMKRRFTVFGYPRVGNYIFHGIFFILLSGLWIIVLYYENTTADTPFERFMDNQGLGVRVLFTGLGVIITFFWDYLWARVAQRDPFRRLSNNRQIAKRSLLMSPATTAFPGLYGAIRQRYFFGSAVAVSAILAKFLPILLSTIPFQGTETWITQLICAWMTFGILTFMIMTLIWSFLVRWPRMPVEPTTIVGMMSYVCDSKMVDDFEGLSGLKKKEQDFAIRRMNREYRLGQKTITNMKEKPRISVDYWTNIRA